VRYKRFPIDSLVVTGRNVSLRYGDLLVAVDDGSEAIDWEVLAASNDEVQLEPSPYALELESGPRAFTGDAILVRSDGLAHVFRGIGPLSGLAVTELG
jgi:hypothetical protein